MALDILAVRPQFIHAMAYNAAGLVVINGGPAPI
jgi:hypothetical protein